MKSRHELPSDSILFTTTQMTTYHNCHKDILSQWLRRSSSNIKVRLHLTSNTDQSYKNFHMDPKLHHFINHIYNQFLNLNPQIKKSSIGWKKSVKQKNRKNNSLGTIHQTSPTSTRIVNTSRKPRNSNHTRIRRNILHENTLNDEDDVHAYGTGDRSNFRNRQENIAEEKRGFDGEYYAPIETKFKMRDHNELYEDNTNHINNARGDEEERYADKRYMQNDENLVNPDRLLNSDNLNLNADNYRQYFKSSYNQKKLSENNFNNDNYMLDKERDANERKFLDNDYLDRQDQLENED
ncbi:unnamed protein product [Rotaria magnacalcarata]|uniref:Uncharacterized protein n=1 Tax=Rotaria magnacalcarata TaxID=392030 RepID=A0A815PYZ6_9BILA